MNKSRFIETIKEELIKIDYKDTDNVIEYYEELIDERIEGGEKEEAVIESLGNTKDILKSVVLDQKIEIAKEKPTISNGLKALIACLGFLSLPLLIPLVIVGFSLLFAIVIVIFSLFIVLCSMIFAGVVGIGSFIGGLVVGQIPFATFLFCVGVLLVLSSLAFELIRLTFDAIRAIIMWLVSAIKKRIDNKRGNI